MLKWLFRVSSHCVCLIVVFVTVFRIPTRAYSDSGSTKFYASRKKSKLSYFPKEIDKECNTRSWLECKSNGLSTRKIVEKLK